MLAPVAVTDALAMPAGPVVEMALRLTSPAVEKLVLIQLSKLVCSCSGLGAVPTLMLVAKGLLIDSEVLLLIPTLVRLPVTLITVRAVAGESSV
ncbi:MAG: hypothetical protein IPJ48_21860 [Propionivibrio sp.]|uniref:Uncharacterized protein n=1 Tax=Candidatus Propionivibrio dominans TaxID=2954373 RepID=A0A9D7FB37_9RHOO|nr:hypothetical protein [Candidatus Propionivibrio dominans]